MQNQIDAIVLCGERQFTLPDKLENYATLDEILTTALRAIPDHFKPLRFNINFSLHCIYSDLRVGTVGLFLQSSADLSIIKEAYHNSGRTNILFTLEKPEGVLIIPASDIYSLTSNGEEERFVPIFHKHSHEFPQPNTHQKHSKTLMSAPLVEFEQIFKESYEEEMPNKVCDFILIHKGGIDDGATLPPGGEFSKTWMISKSSDVWGDALIECVSGCFVGSKFNIPAIDGNGSTRIILNLKAPEKIGWSSSFWRVVVNGDRVGPSLWIEFEVREAVVEDEVLVQFMEKLMRDHIEEFTLNQILELYRAGCDDTEKLYILWKKYGNYSNTVELISQDYFAD